MIPNDWFEDLRSDGYEGSISDMMFSYLGDEGYTGTLNDRLHEWLGAKGYTGTLGDRITNAINDGVVPVTQLLSNATLTRASSAWAWGSDQLLDEYAADELRRDYDPATGAFRGVLVEESRTNSLQDNRDLSTGNWNPDAALGLNQNAVGMDGAANTAWEVVDSDSSSLLDITQELAINNDAATHAVVFNVKKESSSSGYPHLYALLAGGTNVRHDGWLNKETGVFNANVANGSHNVIDKGAYWRVEIVITNNSSGNNILSWRFRPASSSSGDSFDPSATGSSIIDYPQVELNTGLPSSPIETDGTATTRAADVLEGSFSESSGTLHFVGEHKGGDGVLWQADDGTANNRIRLEVSGGNVQLVVDDGGVNQATLDAGALASDGSYDVAARFDSSDFAVSLDGATAVTSASGAVPSVTTQRFGRDTSATTGLNWYKTATYRAGKLNNSELEALTA